jgi:hypothetical protein
MQEHKSRTPRHYIIVVHGIGEQKLNQTATEVVHRFAEVRWKDRHPNVDPRKYQILLPADLSGQSVRRRGAGHGWSEFNGIPVDPADDTYAFDGKPATDTSGRNFRFVDLHWQHILQWHQKEYASPAEKWGPAVLERIGEEKGMVPKGWIPEWATPLLSSIVKTAVPVKKLLSWRYPDLTKLMFDDYLGDVHLYGDYARTRGKAVRHFHVILDEIHLRDFINWSLYEKRGGDHYEPPVYTIFAHSLGSIMSFDALVYAYAREDIRDGSESAHHTSPSLPFPGYTEAAEPERETWVGLITRLRDEVETGPDLRSKYLSITEKYKDNKGFPVVPPLVWRDCVKHFITVGSPIDKYHVIWFQNYLHMGLRRKDDKLAEGHRTFAEFAEDWAKGWLGQPQGEGTIVHYNLCDEQDPVGHHLDVAQACENYGKIFNTSMPVAYRDVVFRRYAVPGVAHVKYWEDGDLFKGIVKEVIDGEKVIEGPDPDLTECERQKDLGGSYFLRSRFRDRRGVYEKALLWAYFRVPFLAALLTGGLLSYGLYPLYAGRIEDFGIFYIGVLLATLLLWTSPRPAEAYVQEARPEEAELEVEKTAQKRRWKFKRSILAHLVAGMVEWRRVLLLLSAGQSTDREECLQKGLRLAFKKGKERTGQFWKNFKKRFVVGAAVLGVSFLLASPYFANFLRTAGWIGTILSLSYLGTMIYVRHLYKEAIERWEESAA